MLIKQKVLLLKNKQKNEAVKNTLQQKMKLLKILYMMTWLENLMLFKLKILVI